ncbi:hypothetical protein ACFPVV_03045 [Macrococcoides bohemicum]|uniref:Uncharacterized protein n=1 Tax=Macrococcoides bohemicum TaxID=1903056 RepID=A0A328A7G6_9STAP|nr:hypothetical protein [Macrococcus bohemicus]RAK50452.1 hypothetical protein BHX94_03010 [Macrococcus bohemicus]
MKISTLSNGDKKIDFNNGLLLTRKPIDVSESKFIAGVRNSKLEIHNLHVGLLSHSFKHKLYITWIALKFIWTDKDIRKRMLFITMFKRIYSIMSR